MNSNVLRQPTTVVFNTDYNVMNYLSSRRRGVLTTNDFLQLKVT